jgi:hypothetical protein
VNKTHCIPQNLLDSYDFSPVANPRGWKNPAQAPFLRREAFLLNTGSRVYPPGTDLTTEKPGEIAYHDVLDFLYRTEQ